MKEAIAEEREACAVLAENIGDGAGGHSFSGEMYGEMIAGDIRKRGEESKS